MKGDSRMVWVCSACLTAACWNGEFYCAEYRTAGIQQMTARKLRKLAREHPSHWDRPWNGKANREDQNGK
jgi:hypothetical protein